jgi:hypothetical protein
VIPEPAGFLLTLESQEAAQNAKNMLEVGNASAGGQVVVGGRKMKAQFHSSRWSRTKLRE